MQTIQGLGQNPVVLARKSYVAYILPMGIWLTVWSFILMDGNVWLNLLWPVVGVLIVMYLRSYVLFMDDLGVWLRRGIFPWDRGIVGVRWRDLREGLFYLNPLSWLTRSYTIEIGNRYQDEPEILLTQMYRGDQAIMRINRRRFS